MKSLYLVGPVCADTVRPLLAALDAAQPGDPAFCLKICTEGGELGEMYALIAGMRTCAVAVHTFGYGEVCSAGVDILAAGRHRALHPLTLLMTHAPVGNVGAAYDRLELARSKQSYAGKRQVLENWGRLFSRRKRWHTAQEAVNYGFADELSEVPV